MDSETRVRSYLRQTGKEVITIKQRRRFMKKVRRELYNGIRTGCGHRMKKCDCPF